MKGKTKTILTVIIAILIFATAVVGTVTFLKDNGESSATEEGVGNVLPVTGSDDEQTETDGEQNPAEGLEGEENPVEGDAGDSEEGTTAEGETTTGTTGTQGTTVGGQLEPEPTTIEQERLVSTTLNWSSISLNSTIGDTGINYTNLAYTVKYYQVVNEEETNLLNTEAGIAEYASTVTVAEEQIKENCPVGYKLDETSELSVVISENVEANLIEVYYIKDSFNLTVKYVYENESEAAEAYTDIVEFEEEYNVESPEIVGYTADITVVEGTMPAEDVEVTVTYKPNTDTEYKVEHYLENLDGEGFTLTETENKAGTTDTEVTAEAKTFEGFTFDNTVEGTVEKGIVAGDGSLVLKLYYTRNSYKVTYEYEGTVPADATALPQEATYKYGANVTVAEAATATGYTFSGWDKENFTMPAQDVVIKGSFTINEYTYTVEYYYENASGEFVGPDEIASYTKSAKYQDVVTYEPKDQNGTYVFFKVESAGVEGEANLTVTEKTENNIIKVYYERNSYDYKVVYYKDSVNGTKLGKTAVKEQKLGTVMNSDIVAADFGPEWINAFKSELDAQEGYQDGEVQEYITIQANDNNVINVVYEPRTDIGYTVEYYFNNEPDTTGKNYSGTATYGEDIEEVTDYSNSGEWTLDTTKSTALPFTIGVANNVIRVYYVKPIITVEKTRTPSVVRDNNTVEPGETITYTITATNNGYKEGTITIADTVPTGTTLNGEITVIGFTTPTVTEAQLEAGIELTVPAQGEASVTFTVTVTANAGDNDIVNTPTVNGTEDANNTVTNPVEKTVSVKAKSDNSTITNSNIVIVLDTSGSMDDPATKTLVYDEECDCYLDLFCPGTIKKDSKYYHYHYEYGNETRAEVAKKVINGFIDKIDLPETQTTESCAVTVVEFSDIPTVIGTADTASEATTLKANVNNFSIAGGTYMADGLIMAKTELQKLINVRPNNKNIVIFVSDGEPSSTYGLYDAATALKNVPKTTVYTVAFGSDISILEDTIATDPSKYYTTETSGSLGDIFSEVNADITGTPEDTQSTDGLIELAGIYADATHPIKIAVNGTALDDITTLPTDASGKVIFKDGTYYLDLSKFEASANITIEYFAE